MTFQCMHIGVIGIPIHIHVTLFLILKYTITVVSHMYFTVAPFGVSGK